MPEIRKAPRKESKSPIMEIPMARVRLTNCELSTEPVEVSYEKNGEARSFVVDPGLNALVEVVDDNLDGDFDGAKFWQRFKMKMNQDERLWEVRPGTALGNLIEIRYGEGVLESDEELIVEAEDFEDFELMAQIVPKENPVTRQQTGSMCKWDGLWGLPKKKKKDALRKAQEETERELDELPDEPDFSDLKKLKS